MISFVSEMIFSSTSFMSLLCYNKYEVSFGEYPFEDFILNKKLVSILVTMIQKLDDILWKKGLFLKKSPTF